MRSQGAGGQSVNTTDSACRVTHMPTGTIVTNQDQKSQEANKMRALEVMKERLFQVHFDKYMEELRVKRQGQLGSMDRSDKIRTYNFPQDRITDHRINKTEFGLDGFFSGGLIDDFIDEYKERENAQRIELLIQEEKIKSMPVE